MPQWRRYRVVLWAVPLLGVAVWLATGRRPGTVDAPLPSLPITPVPVKESFANLDRARVWFIDHGEGPAVLLLHGGGGGNANQWREQVPALRASGLRAVVPDLPGFRQSRPDDPDVDVRDTAFQAEVLRSLLRHLRIPRADVVGHSWGARVAVDLARLDPDLVRSLTLVDAAVSGDTFAAAGELAMPVLIVWARNDPVIPWQVGLRLHRSIPRSAFVLMDDVAADVDPARDPTAPHTLPLYEPEAFNPMLISFLRNPEALDVSLPAGAVESSE